MLLAACGGNGSNPPTPTASDLQTDASNPGTPTERATLADVATTSTDASTLATPLTESPASPTNTADSVAPPAITNTPANEGELPGGLHIGTPEGDNPIDEDNPPPTKSGVIPTPQSSDFDTDGNGVLSTPELIEALRATYPTYDWPPAYVYDLDTAIDGIEKQAQQFTSLYETGMEQTMLGGPYRCAWMLTLRDALVAGDEPLIAESIDRVRTELATNPSMAEIREYAENALDKAELGDPGPLQQMIEIDMCATITWLPATPDAASLPWSGGFANGNAPEFDVVRRRWKLIA
jgi:hypothetical protein